MRKRQKVEDEKEDKESLAKKKSYESETYKSLFKQQYEEDKERDFLCRNVHYGLR